MLPYFIVNCNTCKCIQDLSKIQDPSVPNSARFERTTNTTSLMFQIDDVHFVVALLLSSSSLFFEMVDVKITKKRKSLKVDNRCGWVWRGD